MEEVESLRESSQTVVIREGNADRHSLHRIKQIVQLLTTTILYTRTENQHLKKIILDMGQQIEKHGEHTKRQLDEIRLNVENLCKDLQFFKEEVISDAKKTNEEYVKMQKKFEEKYGFRMTEIELLNSKVQLLEEKLKSGKKYLQNMEAKLAYLEARDQNYTNMDKITSEMDRVKKEMEEDAAKLRRQLESAQKKHKEAMSEMKCAVNIEKEEIEKLNEENQKLKINIQEGEVKLAEAEAELRKQSFIARTYAAMDQRKTCAEELCSPMPALSRSAVENSPFCRSPSGAWNNNNSCRTPSPQYSPNRPATPVYSCEPSEPPKHPLTPTHRKTPRNAKTPSFIRIPSTPASRPVSAKTMPSTPASEQSRDTPSLKRNVISWETYLEKRKKL